jgi:hypothetical protein
LWISLKNHHARALVTTWVWGALKVSNELPMGLLEKGLDVA